MVQSRKKQDNVFAGEPCCNGSALGPGGRTGKSGGGPPCPRALQTSPEAGNGAPVLRNWLITLLAVLFLNLAGTLTEAANLSPRWRWSNPQPHGGHVYDMAYGWDLTVQAGECGQIYTSEDLVYWEPRDSGTTNTLLAVTFLGERLIVAGENGTVVYADSLADFQVLSLGTTDWLLGAAASANFAVLVGDNAAIYTSPEGTNWTRRPPPANFTDWLRSVAYGKNTFIAVGESGAILSSANGVSWKKENSGVTAHLNRVSFVSDQFWVAGEGGVVLTSPNGNSWTRVSAISSTNTFYAAAGLTNRTVVAGAGELLAAAAGGPWSSQINGGLAFPAPRWTYYCAQTQANMFFVAGRSGLMIEGISTNGGDLHWTLRHQSLRNWLWEVTRAPEFYLAVGDRATLMTSGDGVAWSLELTPTSATNAIFLGAGGTSNLLLAVGNKGTILRSPASLTNVVLTNYAGGNPVILTSAVSTLGVIWHHQQPAPTTNDLQAVAASPSLFLVAGGNGTILTSPDGVNWQARSSPTQVFLSGAAYFPGGFVVVGNQGVILTSPDGHSWSLQNSGTTNWIYRVRYLEGQLVAVGQNGTLLISADGTNWTRRATGVSTWLNDAACVEGTWFLVGNQGAVLGSSNLVDWLNLGTITQKSLFGAAVHEGQLVVVGVEGAIIRSPVVPSSAAPSFVKMAIAPPTNSLARKLFLVAGKPDQRFSVENSTNLVSWAAGPLLEFLDSTGTLLYLEESEAYPKEFFRARLHP